MRWQTRSVVWTAICWLTLFLFADPAIAQTVEGNLWERIVYPSLSIKGVPGTFLVSMDSASRNSESHLRCSINWGTGRSEADRTPDQAVCKASQISVRLHLSDGKVVTPEGGGIEDWSGITMGGGTDWSLSYFFPWGANKLEEGWIEIGLPQQKWWIELPYGFTRNPVDPLIAEPDRGPPEFPPAMKELPVGDLLVPWNYVEYDLGAIEHGKHLSVHISNPFRPRAEVILYRENGRWDLHSSQTSVEVSWPGGRKKAMGVGIRLTDPFRRSDDYFFGTLGDEKGRVWGKLMVALDGQNFECTVPSSLFKYVHGITGPYHKQRLPTPRLPDGDF